jgi:predicted nucleic acid-binding protein
LSLFVDTSVWSLTFRRDAPDKAPEVAALIQALGNGEFVLSTGLVLQELLQGFAGPTARDLILDRFSAITLISPDREDHILAAALKNHCRRNGVQVTTVDALLAQLCIGHDLTMLTADRDFSHIAQHSPLRLWRGG